MTNNKDSAVLAPCPFCGGEAEYFKRTNTGAVADWCGASQHWVCCVGDCENQTCLHETPEQAITAWNKRQPTQSDTLREALEGWRTIYQLAPPHPDIAPEIWQDMIDRTAAALAALQEQSK